MIRRIGCAITLLLVGALCPFLGGLIAGVIGLVTLLIVAIIVIFCMAMCVIMAIVVLISPKTAMDMVRKAEGQPVKRKTK